MARPQLADTWPFARDSPLLPPPRLNEIRELGLVDIRLTDGSSVTLATRFDDVKDIIKHPEISADGAAENFPYMSEASRANRGTRLTFERTDPPRHDLHRFMLATQFTLKRVRSMRPFIEELVARLLDEMEAAGSPVDLVKHVAEPIPGALISLIFDIPESDSAFFHDRIHVWMDEDNSPEVIAQANADIIDYFDKVIDERRGGEGDDLISRLIRDQLDTGTLTRPELLNMLQLLVAAGADTTANMIALGVVSLLESPGKWQELVEDPTLVPTAIEELLRFVSPAHHAVFRLTKFEIPVGSEVIPASKGVIASTLAANHDPNHYENPAELDLRRDARDHLAFGAGLHQCLGQALVRAELLAVFAQLPKRFPSLSLVKGVNEMKYRNAMVYGVEEVMVTW